MKKTLIEKKKKKKKKKRPEFQNKSMEEELERSSDAAGELYSDRLVISGTCSNASGCS